MSSYRKKYAANSDGPHKDWEAPVTAPPSQAAAPPAVEPKSDEPAPAIEQKSPADAAAASAIKSRIAEMERGPSSLHVKRNSHRRNNRRRSSRPRSSRLSQIQGCPSAFSVGIGRTPNT